MIRLLLRMLPLACLSLTTARAQEHVQDESRWLAGGGATYCSFVENPGVNLNITYRLLGNLHIGPDFSAILTKEKKENGTIIKRKEVEYNFNAQYLWEVNARVAVYPLAGVNWSRIVFHPEDQPAEKRWITALNVGGGVEWRHEKFRLFFEPKYVTHFPKYDLTAGIIFAL